MTHPALAALLTEDEAEPQTLASPSGLRTRDAGELRESLRDHLWSRGITRVAHLTGFDIIGMPVHMAVKPQGRSLSSGSGKGLTTDASWVSAVMEAWEQSVWEDLGYPGSDDLMAGANSLDRLGVRAVDAGACAMVRRHTWTRDTPTWWTAGLDLLSGEQTWVPAGLVALLPANDRPLSPFVAGSNGLASGAHVFEAVLSGLLEVVERDGMALYSSTRPRCDPSMRLQSCAPQLLERIQASGLVLEVVDVTTELGIPTYVAHLGEPEGGAPGGFKGAGAGLDPDVALVRAVTEAVQARCLIVAGARDDVFETNRAAAVRFSRPRSHPTEPLPECASLATGSIVGDVVCLLGVLQAAGFDDVVVIRHTGAQDPVQVVRVIIPGLEGYPFANAAPGARAMSMSGT